MDINELWVGDQIYIKSKAEYALFQGKGANNQYKVKTTDGAFLEIPIEDIALSPGNELSREPSGKIPKTEVSNASKEKHKNTIDLDQENLKENYPRHYYRLLDYQLEVCEEFLSSCIAQRISSCRIIYGLEETALKSAVASLIRKHPEVAIYAPHVDQDAWDVWFDLGEVEE